MILKAIKSQYTMFNRYICFLLAMILLINILPVRAFAAADEETYNESEAEAEVVLPEPEQEPEEENSEEEEFEEEYEKDYLDTYPDLVAAQPASEPIGMFSSGLFGIAIDAPEWVLNNITGVVTVTGPGTISNSNLDPESPLLGIAGDVLHVEFQGSFTGGGNMSSLFRNLPNLLTVTGLENIDTSNTERMDSMFLGTPSLTTIEGLENWNVSNVRGNNRDFGFSSMFFGANSLVSLDLSNWNVGADGHPVGMYRMFRDTHALTTIGDVSNWNASSIIYMGHMFNNARQLVELPGIANWDVSNVRSMHEMFSNANTLTHLNGIENWRPGRVANFLSMFNATHSLVSLDLSGWNVGADISAPTNISMYRMFSYTHVLTSIGDVSGWDVSRVNHMGSMFRNAFVLQELPGIGNWDTSNVTRMDLMFLNTEALTHLNGIGNWDVGRVTGPAGSAGFFRMFEGMISLTSLDLSGWSPGEHLTGTQTVSMSRMFTNTHALTSIGDVGGWAHIYRTINMQRMFDEAGSLAEIPGIENWDTSNVTNMEAMFRGMNSLTRLDLSSWDTSSVTNMSSMFTRANALRVLTLGPDWVVPSSSTGLPAVSNAIPYTGHWRNIENGTEGNPLGEHSRTSANLMTGNNASSNTWVWETRITVTFDWGNWPGAAADVIVPNVLPGTAAATLEPATPPNRPGWALTGWTPDLASHTNLRISQTFTAIWTSKFTVTFVSTPSSGGTLPGNMPVMVIGGETISLALGSVPTAVPETGWTTNHLWMSSDPLHTGGLFTAAQVMQLPITTNTTFTLTFTRYDNNNQGSGGTGDSTNDSGSGVTNNLAAGVTNDSDSNVNNLNEQTQPYRYAYLIGSDGLLRPNDSITRAEVATILFRLITDAKRYKYWKQENPFPDVELENWFNNAVSTMTNAGVFVGLPDGIFAPNQFISRAELAATLVRFMGASNAMPVSENHFSDISDHWANRYIRIAAANGWIHGNGNDTFRPSQPVTRAEAAAIFNRITGRLSKTRDDLLRYEMITWPDNADENAWYYLYLQSASNSYYYEMTDDVFSIWVAMRTPRDWPVLEQPHSTPGSIF